MHGHDAAVLGDLGKDVRQLAVGHPNGMKGGEDLEAGHALLHGLADLADGLRRHLAGQNIVEGIVGVGVGPKHVTAFFHHAHDRLGRRVALVLQTQVAGKIDNRRHPAKGGRPTGVLGRLGHDVGLTGPLAGHRNADMGVGFDAARNDDLARRVNLSPGVRSQAARPADGGNFLALNADIHLPDGLGSDHLSAFDNKIEHDSLLVCFTRCPLSQLALLKNPRPEFSWVRSWSPPVRRCP